MCTVFGPIYPSDMSDSLAQSWNKPACSTMHLHHGCTSKWPMETSKHSCTVLSLWVHTAEGILAVTAKDSKWPDRIVVTDNPQTTCQTLRALVVSLSHAATFCLALPEQVIACLIPASLGPIPPVSPIYHPLGFPWPKLFELLSLNSSEAQSCCLTEEAIITM